jgi:putative oxidoreductase
MIKKDGVMSAGSKDIGLLVFRILVSLLMIFPHGYQKAVNFGARSSNFPDPLGIGSFASLSGTVFTEVICSILIILGVKTRLASTPLLFTMLVAAFMVHGNDPWKMKEKAVLFGVCYLLLMITGGGKYSVRD